MDRTSLETLLGEGLSLAEIGRRMGSVTDRGLLAEEV